LAGRPRPRPISAANLLTVRYPRSDACHTSRASVTQSLPEIILGSCRQACTPLAPLAVSPRPRDRSIPPVTKEQWQLVSRTRPAALVLLHSRTRCVDLPSPVRTCLRPRVFAAKGTRGLGSKVPASRVRPFRRARLLPNENACARYRVACFLLYIGRWARD
jgi:hypothetical protein